MKSRLQGKHVETRNTESRKTVAGRVWKYGEKSEDGWKANQRRVIGRAIWKPTIPYNPIKI